MAANTDGLVIDIYVRCQSENAEDWFFKLRSAGVSEKNVNGYLFLMVGTAKVTLSADELCFSSDSEDRQEQIDSLRALITLGNQKAFILSGKHVSMKEDYSRSSAQHDPQLLNSDGYYGNEDLLTAMNKWFPI